MNENFKKPTNNLFEEYSQIYEIEVQLHNQARSTNIENSNKLEEQDKNITEITSTKKDNQTNSNKDINVENNKDKKKDYKINSFSLTEKQLDFLCKLLEKKRPESILEYWCGVTTKVFEDYCKDNKGVKYIGVEHDLNYKINNNVHIFELKDNPDIWTNLYNGLENFLRQVDTKFDFIL